MATSKQAELVELYEGLQRFKEKAKGLPEGPLFQAVARFLAEDCGVQIVELFLPRPQGKALERCGTFLMGSDGVCVQYIKGDVPSDDLVPMNSLPRSSATMARGPYLPTFLDDVRLGLDGRRVSQEFFPYEQSFGSKLTGSRVREFGSVPVPVGPGTPGILRVLNRRDGGAGYPDGIRFASCFLATLLAEGVGRSEDAAEIMDVLVGESPAIRRTKEHALQFGASDLPIIILGERGTGKGLLARAIHQVRGGDESNFFSVNCSSIPETLAESELFGHTKGAFTGAEAPRDGLFLTAHHHKGGLFLDEVSEFPPAIQPKLLKVIEEREFFPVGSDRPVILRDSPDQSIRIYAACLRESLSQLRPDLRDRLSSLVLDIPPLRQRQLDLLLLADHFVGEVSARSKVRKTLTSESRSALLGYDWPGNVRQLYNVMARACVLSGRQSAVDRGVVEESIACELRLQPEPTPSGRASFEGRIHQIVGAPYGIRRKVGELERMIVEQALDQAAGNKTHAARLLGVSLRTLHYWLQRWIEEDSSPER